MHAVVEIDKQGLQVGSIPNEAPLEFVSADETKNTVTVSAEDVLIFGNVKIWARCCFTPPPCPADPCMFHVSPASAVGRRA